MKKFKRTLMVSCAAVLAASSVFGLVACGEGGGGGDDDGGKGGGGKVTSITFQGGGDANEQAVFGTLVNNFNSTVGKEKGIKVTYSGGNDDYDSYVTNLTGTPPDVVYVPDRQFKKWANARYLAPLTNPNTGEPLYDGLEAFTAPGAIWEQGINRYRFDLVTKESLPDDTLWALPKDIGPSVLYYNREYIEYMGITHLSLTEEEAKEAGYPARGYFEKDNKWYFNNKIPMSWDEVTDLAIKMQNEIQNVNINGKNCTCAHGYFTEWWFNYGWGVGGDCLEYVAETANTGYYRFTLNDETVNWIVKDDYEGTLTVNGTAYKAGQTIDYADKTASGSKDWQQHCNKLPSMYDAFLEFVSLTAPMGEEVGTRIVDGKKVTGKDVSVSQTETQTRSARDRFSDGEFGMYVGLRADVTHLRKEIGSRGSWMSDQESWDVAPLPLYKEYDADGNVKVHGVQAGHSGSMGLAIANKSKKKEAAWELVKYIAGVEGQSAQAEAGFCIPNQIDVAKTDVFLQPDKAPKNSQVFVDAAEYERPADWWYLTDWTWIDDWANCLNFEVRSKDPSKKKTVKYLFDTYGQSTQELLYKYTTNSHNP